jgi:hypothetical protein
VLSADLIASTSKVGDARRFSISISRAASAA